MKQLLPLLICLFLFACNSTKPATKVSSTEKIDYCLVSGQVKGAKEMTAMVAHRGSRFRVNVQLDADGYFSDTLRGPVGRYIFYLDGKYVHCYLKPGFSIQINTALDNFEKSCKFTGKGASNSSIMQEMMDTYQVEFEGENEFMKLDEEAFSQHMQTTEKKIQKFVDDYKGLDVDFAVFLKEEAHYQCLFQYLLYKDEHASLLSLEDYKPSEAFYAPLAKVNFDTEESYDKHSMFSILAQLYYTRNTDTTKASYLEVIETAKNFKSDVAREEIYSCLEGLYEPGGKHNEAIYAAVMETYPDSALCEEIKAKKASYKTIAKGNLVPEMIFSDVKDKTHKLSDYKGKYIFIDAWATWCAPCKQEIPSLEELIEAYQDKKIVFMSVSLDQEKDKDKWKAMIEEKEMQGLQVIVEEHWESEFAKFFMIRSIPRFLLIDPAGKIVNANMPRPSEKTKIHKILDALF